MEQVIEQLYICPAGKSLVFEFNSWSYAWSKDYEGFLPNDIPLEMDKILIKNTDKKGHYKICLKGNGRRLT